MSKIIGALNELKIALLEHAQAGGALPRLNLQDSRERQLFNCMHRVTNTSSDRYDKHFHTKLRTLRPDWFIFRHGESARQRHRLLKEEILSFARKGAERRSLGKALSRSLTTFTSRSALGYDAGFTQQVKTLAPAWFNVSVNRADVKKNLIQLARRGARRPDAHSNNKRERRLAANMRSLTREGGRYFDQAFTTEIQKLAPRWRMYKTFSRQEHPRIKSELLALARKGRRSSAARGNSLFTLLIKFVNPKQPFFDESFRNKIFAIAPHWFDRSYLPFFLNKRMERLKQDLMRMAAAGETQPPLESPLRTRLNELLRPTSSKYDPVFAKKIVRTAPSWFLKRTIQRSG